MVRGNELAPGQLVTKLHSTDGKGPESFRRGEEGPTENSGSQKGTVANSTVGTGDDEGVPSPSRGNDFNLRFCTQTTCRSSVREEEGCLWTRRIHAAMKTRPCVSLFCYQRVIQEGKTRRVRGTRAGKCQGDGGKLQGQAAEARGGFWRAVAKHRLLRMFDPVDGFLP